MIENNMKIRILYVIIRAKKEELYEKNEKVCSGSIMYEHDF